jgi:hypothetical protein
MAGASDRSIVIEKIKNRRREGWAPRPLSLCSVLEPSTPRALGSRGWDHHDLSLPREDRTDWSAASRAKPPDVLTLQHIIKSLEQENAWLKQQLAHKAASLSA